MLTELRAQPQGIAWEAKLSASVALLRSVGHVLRFVDRKKSPLRQAIDNHWKALEAGKANKKPKIFWEFICEERNLILKEGKLRAGQSTMVAIVGVQATALAAGQSPPPPPPQQSPRATHSYHMTGGSFVGRDPHDLIEEAIKWWRSELETIEENAKASP